MWNSSGILRGFKRDSAGFSFLGPVVRLVFSLTRAGFSSADTFLSKQKRTARAVCEEGRRGGEGKRNFGLGRFLEFHPGRFPLTL